jgi:hypothetical protein
LYENIIISWSILIKVIYYFTTEETDIDGFGPYHGNEIQQTIVATDVIPPHPPRPPPRQPNGLLHHLRELN